MIPLSTPAELKKFPTWLLLILFVALILSLMFSHNVSSADAHTTRILVSSFIFPSWPLAILCLWYLWIFYPSFHLRRKRKIIFDFLYPLFALALVFLFFKFNIEAGWGFVFSLLILGSVMRNLIWENVDTLVIGPKIFSVYAVPCYVHVFFFFFYLFLAQLIRPAYGMPEMSIYLVSLTTFLVGFLIRSLEFGGLKDS